MNLEISDIMKQEGRMVSWADKIQYDIAHATPEDKDISATLDNWARGLGEKCDDPNREVAALIRKIITPDVVTPAGELLGQMFTMSSIGEFDDFYGEVVAKNTIQVHEAVPGGNVDRSFIEPTRAKPTWVSLQAETDITFQTLRYEGYRAVARLITFIREALEAKKISSVTAQVAGLIASGSANYFNETTPMPTSTTMDQFVLYLHDMNITGSTPIMFGLNKYIQAITKLPGYTDYMTDREKGFWNRDGFGREYSGVGLLGYSGQRKLGDGSTVVPDKMLIGIAGKIGEQITRGTTRVLEENDIDNERLHIKVTGYTYGTSILTPENIAKMVFAG